MPCFCDNRKGIFLIFKAAVFLIFTLLSGCQSSSHNSDIIETEASTQLNAPEKQTSQPSRVNISPGDVLDIMFFYTPDLNVSQTVRPDGMIALQLIGEVEAEGKSPIELRKELLELYTPHLKTPEITVVIRSFYERRVYVGGQVMAPGIVQMPGKMTLLEAIMQAGGFNVREAEVRNVVVIRHINGQRYGQSIDLKPALKGNKVQPFYLEPMDIVYVPQTTIARVDQWVDQHINKIIPDTGFHISRVRGDTIVGIGSFR